MNIWQIFILLLSFQLGLLALGLFFLKKHGLPYSNRILSLFLVLSGYGIVSISLPANYSTYTSLIRYDMVAITFYGPLFFFYIRNITTMERVTIDDVRHFFPVFFVLVFYGIQTLLKTSPWTEMIDDKFLGTGIKVLLSLLMLGYAYGVQLKLVKQVCFDAPTLKWLYTLNGLFVLFATTLLVTEWLLVLNTKPFIVHIFLFLGMLPLLVLWTYFSIAISGSMSKRILCSSQGGMEPKNSSLPASFAHELQVELKAMMETKKPYLDADLQLDDIARMMNISRHHASQLINDYCHQNFHQFVNRYRVEDAKSLLLDSNRDFGIEEVAFQSGFNNRVSFYRTFKKFEGVSPTEFRNELLIAKK